MGVHLLAFVAARGFLQVFQVSAPLLWPLNLWMPLARHLPEACAAFYDAAVSHAARLRDAVSRTRRRDGTGGGGVLDDYLRYALLSFSD